jgi:hypothetical protein
MHDYGSFLRCYCPSSYQNAHMTKCVGFGNVDGEEEAQFSCHSSSVSDDTTTTKPFSLKQVGVG